MGSRYLISGVQIGMIKGFIDAGESDNAKDILETVETDQYVGYSEGPTVDSDACRLHGDGVLND